MKIQRNDSCPCKSGKKYKNCCMNNYPQNTDLQIESNINPELKKAIDLSLIHDKDSVEKSIDILLSILKKENLTENQILNAKLTLITAKQFIGEHKKALEIIDSLENTYNGKSDLSIYIKLKRSVSYNSLGLSKAACEICDDIMKNWKSNKIKTVVEKKIRGIGLIELGKAYASDNQKIKAKECWEQSLFYLKDIKSEVEHYVRAKANLASLLLNDENEERQKDGVAQLEKITQQKLLIGDLKGVANNYCNLGVYFQRIGRFERAIAYNRQDLAISRKIGDKRDIASSLCNLANLYIELLQFSKARKLLREAKQIGEELKDERLLQIAKVQYESLEILAKEAGINNFPLDSKAFCLCTSGKLFVDCCGRADFEPMDIPHLYGAISEDIKQINHEIVNSGKTLSPLDFILRNTEESRRRLSWCEYELHDGWVSLKELPDMANLHLISAKKMAEASQTETEEISYPLSTIILSVCHLEAFINQLSFFLYENQNHPEIKKMVMPQEFKDKSIILFQKTTQLENKWIIISDCLLGKGWLDTQSVWREIKDLIFIRNELVHFKSDGYEQVVPPSTLQHSIYKKIPQNVEIRNVPHSWPMKLLSPSLAKWAVEISEYITDKFKDTYSLKRRDLVVN
ncbi:MAG: tetratricopeptide repeat protein [Clostridiales bacterium]